MELDGKKIFMLVNYDIKDKSIGITKKIDGEIKTFCNMGATVIYTAYQDKGIAIFCGERQIYYRPYPFPNSSIIRKFRRFFLVQTALKYLENTSDTIDVGYLRNLGFDHSFIRVLKLMKRRNMKVVLEALSWTPETKLFGRGVGWFYIGLSILKNGKKAGRNIDLVLAECNEKEMFGCKAIAFGNGIDVTACKVHKYCGDRSELNLISVANEDIYHGYDRLIKSIKSYYDSNSDVNVKLYLVGEMSEGTKKLVTEYGLENKVFLVGKKSGAELDALYEKCNVAVGPLGQHRVGGKKDTGLKTKEYFARGIPYVYSGEENLLPKDYPYVMKVSSDESALDIRSIYAFWKNVEDDEQCTLEMRDFAKKNYSWERIMKRVFEELDREKR